MPVAIDLMVVLCLFFFFFKFSVRAIIKFS